MATTRAESECINNCECKKCKHNDAKQDEENVEFYTLNEIHYYAKSSNVYVKKHAESADKITKDMYKEDDASWKAYCLNVIERPELVYKLQQLSRINNLAFIMLNGPDDILKDAKISFYDEISRHFKYDYKNTKNELQTEKSNHKTSTETYMIIAAAVFLVIVLLFMVLIDQLIKCKGALPTKL